MANDIAEAVGGLFLIAISLVVWLIATGGIILFCYGVVVLVFRHAFGIELPNPVNLLPAEWAARLR